MEAVSDYDCESKHLSRSLRDTHGLESNGLVLAEAAVAEAFDGSILGLRSFGFLCSGRGDMRRSLNADGGYAGYWGPK